MRQIIYLINSHLSHWEEECNFPFISLTLCFSVDQDVPILLTCIYSHESGSGYRAVTCESNSQLVTRRVLSSQYVHTTRQLELLMGSCRPVVYLCEQNDAANITVYHGNMPLFNNSLKLESNGHRL